MLPYRKWNVSYTVRSSCFRMPNHSQEHCHYYEAILHRQHYISLVESKPFVLPLYVRIGDGHPSIQGWLLGGMQADHESASYGRLDLWVQVEVGENAKMV